MTHRTNAEEWVLKAARQYARMKLFSTTVDANGNVTIHPVSERESMVDFFARKLLKESELLINIMSLDETDDGQLTE